MSYYMGDFYPRGDPGIGSFFTGLAKNVAGMLPGGGIATKIMSKIGKVMPGGAGGLGEIMKGAKGAIIKHPVLTAAGAAGAAMGMGAAAEHMIAGGGGCQPGRRSRPVLKKCGMPLKHGGCGKCHRSMNVCNPRALRRAIRRTRGFAKLAMRTIHIVHPKKKARFGGFKARRRK